MRAVLALVLVVMAGLIACQLEAAEEVERAPTASMELATALKPAATTAPPPPSQGAARSRSPRETTPVPRAAGERTAVVAPARAATDAPAGQAQGPQRGSPQTAGPVAAPEHSTWEIPERHVCRPDESFGRWVWQDFVQWSPDGSTILFSRGPHLHGVTADGTRIWPVADAGTSTVLGDAGTTIPFDISPDGTRVVFATCRYGKLNPRVRTPHPLMSDSGPRLGRLGYELALVGVDGTDPQRLTTNNMDLDSYPAWSPDGNRVAHLYGSYRLKVTPIDGRKPLDVTFPIMQATKREPRTVKQAPAWSPDGRRLAVLSSAGPDVRLVTFDVDGRDRQWLATFQGGRDADSTQGWAPTVTWSPDGSKILVVPKPGVEGRAGFLAEDGHDVYVVTVVGSGRGQVTPLSSRGLYAYAAAWAPDGSRVVVAAMSDFSGNDSRWGAEEPTRWGDVRVRTVAPDGRVLQVVAVRDSDGRLEAWHAPRPFIQDHLTACRTGYAVPNAAANPGLVDDCAALLALTARAGDSGYANWTTDRTLGAWDGVTLGGSPPRVHELRLADGGLRGRDARALRWLTELRRLELSNFGLSYIPRELGELEHLEEVRLVGGRLDGGIPAELGQLSALTHLELNVYQLAGQIPVELGQLRNLTYLKLSANQLTGSIPPEFGQLRNLTYLDLSYNQLTGPIPGELGQLVGLQEVRLSGNPLTGCVPSGLPVADLAKLGLPDCEAAA